MNTWKKIKNIVIEISAPFFLDSLLKSIKDTSLKIKLKKYISLKDLDSCLKLLDNQDRAFKKSNGQWTYFANDAAYHLEKYNRKFELELHDFLLDFVIMGIGALANGENSGISSLFP